MRANELSLENYVLKNGKPHCIYLPEELNHTEQFKPLPATEEWFIIFGFQADQFKRYKLNLFIPFKVEACIFADFTAKGYFFNYMINGQPASENKHYVHELQQMYLGITSHALKLK